MREQHRNGVPFLSLKILFTEERIEMLDFHSIISVASEYTQVFLGLFSRVLHVIVSIYKA